MADDSHLDLKYFIDPYIYNCPFCNRRHVSYTIANVSYFSWSNEKLCHVYTVKCSSCGRESMHLSYEMLIKEQARPMRGSYTPAPRFDADIDLDSKIFYSVPGSASAGQGQWEEQTCPRQ